MSDRSRVDGVASGRGYTVARLNEQAPGALSDFAAAEVVAMILTSGDQTVIVHGTARADGDSVVVYEKEGDGSGKDVRTWRIRERDGRFVATEPSTY